MIENEEKKAIEAQVKEESQIKSDTKVISTGEFEKHICLKEQTDNVNPLKR